MVDVPAAEDSIGLGSDQRHSNGILYAFDSASYDVIAGKTVDILPVSLDIGDVARVQQPQENESPKSVTSESSLSGKESLNEICLYSIMKHIFSSSKVLRNYSVESNPVMLIQRFLPAAPFVVSVVCSVIVSSASNGLNPSQILGFMIIRKVDWNPMRRRNEIMTHNAMALIYSSELM